MATRKLLAPLPTLKPVQSSSGLACGLPALPALSHLQVCSQSASATTTNKCVITGDADWVHARHMGHYVAFDVALEMVEPGLAKILMAAERAYTTEDGRRVLVMRDPPHRHIPFPET